MKRIDFKEKWFFILVIILFMTMVGLGFWQLQRYHEKQQLLSTYHRNMKAPPLPWNQFLVTGGDFRRVTVTGHYLNCKTLLLDSRWHKSRLGYDLLTPFKVSGEDKVLLVNRGWVAAGRTRQDLPIIEVVSGKQTLNGYVLQPEKSGFMLGNTIESGNQPPLRIQQIDIKVIQQATDLDFYPYVLRLLPTDGNEFLQDWQIVNVTPPRHLAYAIQWFVMSVVLVIAYFIFLRKGDDD